MTQALIVQSVTDLISGALFALACGCRQTGAHAGHPPSWRFGERSRDSHIEEGAVGERTTTLSSGQMLLPGIAEPYRWEFGGKR